MLYLEGGREGGREEGRKDKSQTKFCTAFQEGKVNQDSGKPRD